MTIAIHAYPSQTVRPMDGPIRIQKLPASNLDGSPTWRYKLTIEGGRKHGGPAVIWLDPLDADALVAGLFEVGVV